MLLLSAPGKGSNCLRKPLKLGCQLEQKENGETEVFFLMTRSLFIAKVIKSKGPTPG